MGKATLTPVSLERQKTTKDCFHTASEETRSFDSSILNSQPNHKSPNNPMAPSTLSSSIPSSSTLFPFFFSSYIRLDVSHSVTNPNRPHEVIEFLRYACIAISKETVRYISSLSNRRREASAILWPSLFAFSDSEAQTSASLNQHRGCFLIGIDSSSFSNRETDLIQRRLRFFEESVRTHGIFVDEPLAPKFSAKIVRGQDLGPLVLDTHMWPQPLDGLQALVVSSSSGFDASGAYHALAGSQTTPSKPASEKTAQKLRPASDVLHRLRWDPELDMADYLVVYLDRFTGYQELPATAWKLETSDDEFIPLHRITAFRKTSTGEVVWHREARIDKVFA